MLYFIVCIQSDRPEQSVDPDQISQMQVSSGSTLSSYTTHAAILDTTVGSKLYMFKF